MSLRSEIENRIAFYTKGSYAITQTWGVPAREHLGFGRQGRLVETAILYADMRKSSEIAEEHRRQTAAKFYKSFLYAMAKVARSENGQIRAYDGDRIMVVFPPIKAIPNRACNNAVKTAMKMAWCICNLIEPKLREYDSIDCGIGIAFGHMLVVKAGIEGQLYNQDLVWVGKPANLAAKLSEAGHKPNYVWIDEETFKRLTDENKYFGPYQREIWHPETIKFAGSMVRSFCSNCMLEFK